MHCQKSEPFRVVYGTGTWRNSEWKVSEPRVICTSLDYSPVIPSSNTKTRPSLLGPSGFGFGRILSSSSSLKADRETGNLQESGAHKSTVISAIQKRWQIVFISCYPNTFPRFRPRITQLLDSCSSSETAWNAKQVHLTAIACFSGRPSPRLPHNSNSNTHIDQQPCMEITH